VLGEIVEPGNRAAVVDALMSQMMVLECATPLLICIETCLDMWRSKPIASREERWLRLRLSIRVVGQTSDPMVPPGFLVRFCLAANLQSAFLCVILVLEYRGQDSFILILIDA